MGKTDVRVTSKVVEEVVSELAGPDVIPLVKQLRNKTNVSEFTLANALKLEINQTRNMLYRLYEHNLVSFTRKKDKKKGWYIYFWTFNQNRVRDLVKEIRRKRYNKLKERLEREQNNQFFLCENKCIRLDFEQGHDYNFKCPECGQLLNLQDNTKTIENLKNMLADVEEKLAEAETPIKITKRAVKKTKKKKTAKKKTTKKKTKAVKKTKKKKKAVKKTTKKKTKKTVKKAKKTAKKTKKKTKR